MTFEVSVIIPVYNAKRFLNKSIQSALDQEEVKEVLVIDDGSTDGSYEVLQSWDEKEERIRLFTHANRENRGPGPSRNVGIQSATSDFLSFLDADDYYLNNRFNKTIETFYLDKRLGALYEPVKNIYFPDIESREINLPTYKGDEYLAFNKVRCKMSPIENWLLDSGYYGITSLTLRREMVDIIGVFDEDLFRAEDTDYHYRIALKLNVKFNNELSNVKIVRCIHGSNLSLSNKCKENISGYYKKYIFLLEENISAKAKRNFFKKFLISQNKTVHSSRLLRYCKYTYLALKFIFLNTRYLPVLFRIYFR